MARRVAFVLAPIDQGTRNVGGREGSALAPARVIKALRDKGLVPPDARVIEVPVRNQAETLEDDLGWLTDTVRILLEEGLLPIVLGGDHGTTYATVRGLAQAGLGEPGVAYLDVHFDLRRFEPAHTSGSSFRRLIDEALVPPGRVHPLGILRPSDPAALERSRFEELSAWATEQGVPWVPLDAVRKAGVAATLSERLAGEGPWCLSFDVDCLDEQWAPGVSAPGPGRFTLDEVVAAVEANASRAAVFDVVEFVPRLDEEERTLKSVIEVVAAFLRARG